MVPGRMCVELLLLCSIDDIQVIITAHGYVVVTVNKKKVKVDVIIIGIMYIHCVHNGDRSSRHVNRASSIITSHCHKRGINLVFGDNLLCVFLNLFIYLSL